MPNVLINLKITDMKSRISLLYVVLIFSVAATAQTSVIMQHNNLRRTGWDSTETILNHATVSGSFGKIFSRTVDDQIYSQPLIVSGLRVKGVPRNVVFVTTVNNSVYAFDADDANAADPIWHVNLTFPGYRPIKNTDMTGACGGNYKDFSGNMGIVGTPAIDTVTKTLYVVARSVTNDRSNFVQYLHAIDLRTGAEKPNSPVYITATVNGTGDGSVAGKITFTQQTQNQRPALMLLDGVVFIAWSSHCDWSPYHGWFMGFDAKTLKRKYAYNNTPDGGLAGIWMSGQGPAVDAQGNIYLTTGNGTVGKNGNPNDTTNRGESLLKLGIVNGKIKVLDFFTPNDFQYLENYDLDYGVDGVMLIPGTSLSLSGSKESFLYLINNNKMGGMKPRNSNVLQYLNINGFSTQYAKHLHGSPVYFKDYNNKEYIYAWAEGCGDGHLKQFTFIRSKARFDSVNVKVGYTNLPCGMPGAMLSVSSNGSKKGTGIVWASHPLEGDANQAVVPGILQAFDASDITHELWNSNLNATRDGIGNFAKFVVPTIANGKVYMATFSNQLAVYGLNPPDNSTCSYPLQEPWHGADIGYLAFPGNACDSSGRISIASSGEDIWDDRDGFYFVYQPFTATNGEIVAKIRSLPNTNAWAKCGVMFRANLDPSSPHAFMALTPQNGRAFQYRWSQGGQSYNTNQGAYTAPYWVKLVKTGDKYVGYTSPDGTTWSAVDSTNVSMGSYPYVGIAYTTHTSNTPATAVVDNVSVTASGLLITENNIHLNAKNNNNQSANLVWTSQRIATGDYFVIEKSVDGNSFASAGTVNITAKNASSFVYADNAPQTGKNYYRIKQVSKDGTIKFSNAVPVSFNMYSLEIFPNPVKDQFILRYFDDIGAGSKIAIRIINNLGQTEYALNTTIPQVSNSIVINLPAQIKNGVYTLQVINAKGQTRIEKLVVEK